MSDNTAHRISEEERARESTAWPRGYLWKVQVVEMTPAEALAQFWLAAIRDPYRGDRVKLAEAKRILEIALRMKAGE